MSYLKNKRNGDVGAESCYLLVTGTKDFSDCLMHLYLGAAKTEPGTF